MPRVAALLVSRGGIPDSHQWEIRPRCPGTCTDITESRLWPCRAVTLNQGLGSHGVLQALPSWLLLALNICKF